MDENGGVGVVQKLSKTGFCLLMTISTGISLVVAGLLTFSVKFLIRNAIGETGFPYNTTRSNGEETDFPRLRLEVGAPCRDIL